MFRSNSLLVLAICGIFHAPAPAMAGVLLASYSFDEFGPAGDGLVTSMIHDNYLSPFPLKFNGQGTLFEEIALMDMDGDIRVDEIEFGDDPDFPEYAALLTDGLDWWLYDEVVFPNQSGAIFNTESLRLQIANPELFEGCPDLCGATIERVVREVQVDLEFDGVLTTYEIHSVVSIYGVPEPATASILFTLLPLIRRRSR